MPLAYFLHAAALAWIEEFLHRNKFGTKIDLTLFRPTG
jgi:hypothetical protein